MPNIQLREIPERRTHNQKTYDNSLKGGRGNRRHIVHVRHIHYKNPKGQFEDIDTTLHFDDVKKVYKQNKASYHCAIPEYADNWFEFYNTFKGINHTIKAKPVCSHIKGTKIPDQHDGQGHESILYKNAFGQDIDFRVTAYWAGLRKIIIIKKKPTVLENLYFDFELQLPPNSKVIDGRSNEWDKQTGLSFKDKTLRIGADDKYSFLRKARIWDSNDLRLSVDIELYRQDGKTYLRKTIKRETLEKATYPLYTDHPTNYYGGAGDGYITVHTYNDWNGAHDAASGDAKDDETVAFGGTQKKPSPHIYITRAFMPVNTSGLGGAEVISADVKIYIEDEKHEDDDAQAYLNLVQTTQPDPTVLTGADYNNCGDIDDPDKGISDQALNGISEGAYTTWAMNPMGIGWIITDGWTKLGFREGHDIEDEIIAANTINNFRWRTSEYANTGSDPYLDITTGAPPTNPYPTSFLKKGFISTYHCFMSAYIRAKVEGFDPLKLPDGTVF